MIARRLVGVLLALISIVGIIAIDRDRPSRTDAVFANLGAPSAPFVPLGGFINSSWFCPGVPIGDAGQGGVVVVANPSDSQRSARVTVLTNAPDTPPVVSDVIVPARDTVTVDLAALQPAGTFLSSVVEVAGGGGIVEQRADTAIGSAVAACSNSTSSNWLFADGYTLDDSTEDLVITNPFPGDAILNFTFASTNGDRKPNQLQGFPVKGNSVSVVNIDQLIRDESVLSVSVSASRGRVVVARSQRYQGTRTGYTMSLGAPSLRTSQLFADGEVGDGITEQYGIFNPTDQDITVKALFFGFDITSDFANDTEVVVPAHSVSVLDTSTIAGLPAGRHAVELTTDLADPVTGQLVPSFVAERAITRPHSAGGVATTVVMGAPSASTQWSMAISSTDPPLAVEDVLIVYNASLGESTVRVMMLTPGGVVPVPGLEAVPLPSAGVITIPLTDATALGRPLFVQSDVPIVVERRLPRSADLRGRSGSFPLQG